MEEFPGIVDDPGMEEFPGIAEVPGTPVFPGAVLPVVMFPVPAVPEGEV